MLTQHFLLLLLHIKSIQLAKQDVQIWKYFFLKIALQMIEEGNALITE